LGGTTTEDISLLAALGREYTELAVAQLAVAQLAVGTKQCGPECHRIAAGHGQPSGQAKGCGFPVAHLLVLFHGITDAPMSPMLLEDGLDRKKKKTLFSFPATSFHSVRHLWRRFMSAKRVLLVAVLFSATAGSAKAQVNTGIKFDAGSLSGTLGNGFKVTGITSLGSTETMAQTLSVVVTDPCNNIVPVMVDWKAPTPGGMTNFIITNKNALTVT
jgi:hypothetical protein